MSIFPNRTVLAAAMMLAGSLFLAPLALAQEAPSIEDTIAPLVAPLIDSGAVPSVVVGVFKDGEAHVYGFGTVGGDEHAPDGSTIYEIGSITKAFTGTLLAWNVNGGTLTLDMPISELWPEGSSAPKHATTAITLAHLSTHHSGLPRMPANFAPADPADPFADYTEEKLIEVLDGAAVWREPGSAYEYSNLGAGVLGWLLARHNKTTFGELIATRITGPLGMADTAIRLDDGQSERFATGHSDGVVVPHWHFDVLAPAGELRSTADDLLKLAPLLLDPPETELGRALRLATSVQTEIEGTPLSMGLGWHLGGNGAVAFHNGRTGGFASVMVADRRNGIVTIVLANGATDAVDLLGDQIARALTGQEVEPQVIAATVALTGEQRARLVGVYKYEAAGLTMIIDEKDGGLTGQIVGQVSWPAKAVSPSELINDSLGVRLVFAESDGASPSLTLFQMGNELVFERIASKKKGSTE